MLKKLTLQEGDALRPTGSRTAYHHCSDCDGPGGVCQLRNNITATYMNSGTYNMAAQSLVGSFDKTAGVNVKIEAFPYTASNKTTPMLSLAANALTTSCPAVTTWPRSTLTSKTSTLTRPRAITPPV